jgi:acetyltransferase
MPQTSEQLFNELEPLFNPRSIALIGASSDLYKPNGRPLELLRLKQYAGPIYPVNPKYTEIAGMKCYPSLAEIPGEVDMAIIAMAAAQVPNMLRACGKKGVRSAVVFSSGFAEVGPAGMALQQEIAAIAREYDIKMCGPNCLGLLNATNGVTATFALTPISEDNLSSRMLGFVSQSGAFGTQIYRMVAEQGIGFNYFVSVGNEATLEFSDFIGYMLSDSKTKIIGGYLEGAKDGGKLRRVAEKAMQVGKPIMLLKVGKSAVGAKAASSHTGSQAGSDRIYDAFFRQTGIIRIEDLEDLVALVDLFASGRTPAGNRVAIITPSGGAGVLAADKCDELGLSVTELSPDSHERLEKILPHFASAKNPVDTTGQIGVEDDLFKRCIQIAAEDPKVDAILSFFVLTRNAEAMAQGVVEAYNNTDKPVIIITWLGADAKGNKACEILKKANIPLIRGPVPAARALASLAQYSKIRQKWLAASEAGPYKPDYDREKARLLLRQPSFGEWESKLFLGHCGVPVAKGRTAATIEQARQAAAEIGYPVVMKIDAPEIKHKTEAEAVRLNICSDGQLTAAFTEIMNNAKRYAPEAEARGVLVEEMLPPGTEMVVGAVRDPVFGPTVMVGLGGIFVEALEDVAFRVAPITRQDAMEMLEELKGIRILHGLRGRPAADMDALADALLKVSAVALDFKDEIAEIDINPLMVYPAGQGVRAADALVVKKQNN